MKKFSFILLCISSACFVFSQNIQKDSLYLGQTPPNDEPKIFKLDVTSGSFAAERIAISKDGKEIFYSEIKGYYPVVGNVVKCYKYENNHWNGPFILFEGYCCPALSIADDTLFLEANSTYYSVRKNSGWSKPVKFISTIDSVHYLQVTNKGNYYASVRSKSSVGQSDWSKIEINGRDTVAKSLGFPVNRVVDDLDFYMAKDESYMFTCPMGPIGISYPDGKGKWLNSRYLSKKINFGISGWGVYVSPDNKYLFYTTGTKLDYSDVNVYWVKINNMIDSMKNTNLPPYVKNKPNQQNTKVGKFFTYTLPSDAVCDDDGNFVRYEALMLDGSPLPAWLNFDPQTNTISGTPNQTGSVILRINAYDDKNSIAAFRLIIIVEDK